MFWLQTLGGLSLRRDGTILDGATEHRKAMALLAILATSGEAGMAREKVMALLWPESDREHARGALKQMLHTLRRMLGDPGVILGTAQLRLDPRRLESDVGRFLAAMAREDPEGAAAEYGGVFLDGLHLGATPDFERWVDGRRSLLESLYVDALERLARSADASGDHLAALRWWRRLRDTDPLNGRIRMGLMRSLVAAGDRPGALREADLHEHLLRSELDAGPDPAVVQLRDSLRS